MASYVTPKKNTEYVFYIGLPDQADTKLFKSNPTIAAGDFKVSTDGGALGNLSTLPAVTPAAGKMVKVTLSASEMNGDNATLVCSDAAGAEWADVIMNIQTSDNQIDDLALASVCTEARGGAMTDWINGGRLDLLLDAIPTTAMRGTDGVDTAPMRGTDDASTAIALAAIDVLIDALIATIGVAGAGLTDLGGMATAMKAEVNAEVLDVMVTDTHAEPGSVPAATSSIKDKLNWLFILARNKFVQTATGASIKADNAVDEVGSSTDSDDGTDAIRGEWS